MHHTLKKISRSDLQLLENHYLKFEPYSDFNVVSIWGYMVPGARFMHTRGAILYEMQDYNTADGTFLTVFGDSSAKSLVQAVAKTITDPTISLYSVPESTMESLADWSAIVSTEEDVSNHDYIFSVESIANLTSDKLRAKKKKLTKLKRRHPHLEVTYIDHTLPEVRRQMYALFRRWIKDSGSDDWQREYRALQRALKLRGFHVVCLGAYDKGRLVGFTVNEIEKNDYYQGHYGKVSYRYPGLGLLLEHETAKYIHENYGSKYMNLQQDMGIEGIRYYKTSLGPLKQLKKYTIIIDTRKALA
jgi:hypothetical protein